jgi:type IV secretion system protein VirB2
VAALAQASPFATGTTSLTTNLLTILTPIAVVAVMVLGLLAWFDRISWSWVAGAIAGTVLVFGAPQVVDWIRGMFGV